MPCPFSDSWNTCADALEAGGDRGRQAGFALDAAGSASTAWPSETPGARLNEIVTDGCWPWWLTCSGPTEGTSLVTADSGIDGPVSTPVPLAPPPTPAPCGDCRRVVLRKILESADGSVWNSGMLSRMTW